MSQAKNGDTVSINYTGKLADGTLFDSSEGREPLQFQLGAHQIIPGLERAIDGMSVGEKKTVTISPEDAYGERDESRMQAVPRAQLPADLPTEPGTQLAMQTQDGQTLPVTVAESNEETVVLDANHPLAGRELTFDVELVDIKAAA
ncbi:FKBP-type peptidyl-prolyl cis-trans isomerase [Parvularcula lutaonensis]|uniref:Peptidyl-prolyl cis-trans isomerase n=1 Tax=Parvularcula lutaonensis TaxID=491923 RepID=A0ABV7MA20_9PROT|nr:peptidylprolyl isomerase [Parvularcula lutaonensis]GGY36250.1 peptidyl-prolyl cis-trans isomerase [Parvularcula lutaonensis]